MAAAHAYELSPYHFLRPFLTSTTVSDTYATIQALYMAVDGSFTFGEGKIENVASIRSGYS